LPAQGNIGSPVRKERRKTPRLVLPEGGGGGRGRFYRLRGPGIHSKKEEKSALTGGKKEEEPANENEETGRFRGPWADEGVAEGGGRSSLKPRT